MDHLIALIQQYGLGFVFLNVLALQAGLPLPAYAVCALWMALGFAWAAGRYARRPAHAVTAAAVMLAMVFSVGARINLFDTWCVKWSGPSLNARNSAHATEKIDVSWERMELKAAG